MDDRILSLLIALPALISGLTVHEFAHAWAATKLGDTLAQRQGRLTLDPLKHLDPLGSLFMVMSALAGFLIGWAKPVMFDPRSFQHPKRDAMLVAIAGPISNVLQAIIWLVLVAIVARITPADALRGGGLNAWVVLNALMQTGVIVNLTLAAFNMIPIPPLDGHYVLEFLGGPPVSRVLEAVRPYSFMLLIVLLNLPAPYNVLRQVIVPVRHFGFELISLAVTGHGIAQF